MSVNNKNELDRLNPSASLSDDQAWSMLFLYVNGIVGIIPRMTQKDLAEMFDIKQGTVSRYTRIYSKRLVCDIQERIRQKPKDTTMDEIYQDCAALYRQDDFTIRCAMLYGMGFLYQYYSFSSRLEKIKQYDLKDTLHTLRQMKRVGSIINRIASY